MQINQLPTTSLTQLQQDSLSYLANAPELLYGLSSKHLTQIGNKLVEHHTAAAFNQLQRAGAKHGLDIQICSAFRDFERQSLIWNNKALGKRPVLDSQSKPLDISKLTHEQLLKAILLWSAFPGSSRHHWGTDIDVFDAASIDVNDLQLVSEEYQANGPCYELYQWLRVNAARFGFYFPFQHGKSGVSAEPWHLSFYPVAKHFLDAFSTDALAQVLDKSEVELSDELVNDLPNLVSRYVRYVAPLPTSLR
ncbi:M15 family metallopeptidase [Shewanella maritima]|uniref:M15 family metallopeptidase n=1 Tax=Shewanella maritima TaxID=2520507 RepID=UPI001F5FEF49|nr:M15 family metallopeptidase [Shewanella maritima]